MKRILGLLPLAGLALGCALSAQTPGVDAPPVAGPVEILPLEKVEPGMQAVAWTAFRGQTAEPFPVEILGVLKNAWGPRQDIILAKLGGEAERTNVAGGMSGSPVYYEGKLLGAISLRFSVFSPDAIAGITPIELMLEIDEFDRSRPISARLADRPAAGQAAQTAMGLAEQIWNSRAAPPPALSGWRPIVTPLSFSGLHPGVLDLFAGSFRRHGFVAAQGGAMVAAAGSAKTVSDPKGALNPGEPLAAVLMSGDMSAVALGTTTYNDGRKVIGFGHAMFNSGPIEAPIAAADIVHVLASKLAPFKVANVASVVGALRQDRHSGILGALGEQAKMIPVSVRIRTFGEAGSVVSEKSFHYEVFQNERLTAQLLVMALYNSMYGLNDFAQESTFRLKARIEFAGENRVAFRTMQTVSSGPMPAPLLLAGLVGARIQRIFTNTRETPEMESVEVEVDLLPERRLAIIEHAWLEKRRVRPGDTIAGKVFLRPYRGERIVRDFRLRIPAGTPPGRLTVLVGDAAQFNLRRMAAAARNRLMSLPETVSLLNQERSNDRVYISLVQRSLTAHLDDQTMPNLPVSTLNVLRGTANRRLTIEQQSPLEQLSIPLDSIVSGSFSLLIEVL